jgi:hypothetical protein
MNKNINVIDKYFIVIQVLKKLSVQMNKCHTFID